MISSSPARNTEQKLTMAPRGRFIRMGERRIDAALDAMKTYGFSQDVVLTTVNELLEVYGKDGWPFIEDAAYRVLLDAILEKVEQEAQKGSNALQDNERGGKNAEVSAVGTSNGALVVSTCDNVEAVALTSQTNEASDSASQTKNVLDTALLTKETDATVLLPTPRGEGSCWKDKSLDQDCREKQMIDVKGTADGNFGHVGKLSNTSHSPPQLILSPQVDCLPPRRRKPCYGWISSDDEADFVELTPAPLPAELTKLLSGANWPRKRKRRWDVRPGDM